jgi:hypothetical protein
VLYVIYIAEQREIGLGLNTHIFEFDCFFAHEATFNGRSAVGLGVFSLMILQQQINRRISSIGTMCRADILTYDQLDLPVEGN